MTSQALINRIVRLEAATGEDSKTSTVQGMRMQMGRIEKKLNEVLKRLEAVEPVLEQVQLDIDKARAELVATD